MKVLIEFDKRPLYFDAPLAVIATHTPAEVPACFAQMERALADGRYLAGFLSYEAGYAFETCLTPASSYDFPLVRMGVYAAPRRRAPACGGSAVASLTQLRLNRTFSRYAADIAAIRRHIAAGDVYQITYCLKLLFSLCGDAYALYRRLLQEQPVPYPAYVAYDDVRIISLSPEKFVQKQKSAVVTKPMKGTWPRGKGTLADLRARLHLHFDAKNRAENVMIADLLRNDLGRVGCRVRAPRLFEVAGYTTLFQMTSTVRAQVPEDIPLQRLFASLFPSGSVTGAPKIRAMEIIRALEGEERRVYTGAIGYVTPGRDLFFNVPIRTLLLRGTQGELGIGGGIVWDSTPEGEWNEGLLKARFVTDPFGGILT